MNNNAILKDTEKAKAILVGVSGRDDSETEILLDELERLLDTAGGETVARVVQNRSTPDPRTYVGSGKVDEIGDMCKINGVNLVIFDDELSPSQIKNIEEEIGGDVRVIDRSMLILDIFALHATSGEGKLQVEMAQIKYTAPRLTGKGMQLSRQEGGIIAMRGPGETKLETDRRHLHRRMVALQEQLSELEKNRSVMRRRRERSGIKQIAIAGYTNAGKSTLLNYLTEAGILAEDKLFATLDPTTRQYKLPSGEEILLTDTVGFIRNLPHHLVKAFKSTLDEVTYADIILVIIDASDKDYISQTEVTRSLLAEFNATEKPVLYVFNKCDKPALDIPRIADIPVDNALYISAATGQGVDLLIAKLERIVTEDKQSITLRIPNNEQNIINAIYKNASVTDIDYGNEYVTVKAVADAKAKGMFGKYLEVREEIKL
ncbi:MAG: GTPase HflX [Eubacteriales bacterium]